MRRTIAPLVLLFAAGLVPGSLRPVRASAFCTIDPNFNPVTSADSVVFGRIDRVARDFSQPESAHADPSLLTVSVDRVLKGDPQPAAIEVQATIPERGVAAMCPQFDRDRLAGRWAVIALRRDGDSALRTDRLLVWFVGDSRLSIGQDALARLADGPPSAPPTGSAGHSTPIAKVQQPWVSAATLLIALSLGLTALAWRASLRRVTSG